MTTNGRQSRALADARVKRTETRILGGQRAFSDYEATRHAQNANLMRLTELRLAREAAAGPVLLAPPKKRAGAKAPTIGRALKAR